MKRKIMTVILSLALVISFTGPASAATGTDIPIYVDGVQLETGQPPFMKDGRVFVPMRAIFEAMGAKVEYDSKLDDVIVTKGLISMRLDYTGPMLLNGKMKQVEAYPVNIDGTTFVPLRTVAEALFAEVGWKDGSVYITSNKAGYEEYPGIPDFGKALELKVVDKTVIKEGSINLGPQLKAKATLFVHMYAVESAKKEMITDYQNQLGDYGFELIKTDKENDSYNTTVSYYYNKERGTHLSIHQVGTDNYVVGVCISVPVSPEGLGLKATN